MPTIERKSKFIRSISIHNKRKLRWEENKSYPSYLSKPLFFDGKVYKNFSLTVIKKLIKNKSLVEILGEKGIIIGNNKNYILFINYDNYQNLGTFSLINYHFIDDVELIKFAYSNILKEKIVSNNNLISNLKHSNISSLFTDDVWNIIYNQLNVIDYDKLSQNFNIQDHYNLFSKLIQQPYIFEFYIQNIDPVLYSIITQVNKDNLHLICVDLEGFLITNDIVVKYQDIEFVKIHTHQNDKVKNIYNFLNSKSNRNQNTIQNLFPKYYLINDLHDNYFIQKLNSDTKIPLDLTTMTALDYVSSKKINLLESDTDIHTYITKLNNIITFNEVKIKDTITGPIFTINEAINNFIRINDTEINNLIKNSTPVNISILNSTNWENDTHYILFNYPKYIVTQIEGSLESKYSIMFIFKDKIDKIFIKHLNTFSSYINDKNSEDKIKYDIHFLKNKVCWIETDYFDLMFYVTKINKKLLSLENREALETKIIYHQCCISNKKFFIDTKHIKYIQFDDYSNVLEQAYKKYKNNSIIKNYQLFYNTIESNLSSLYIDPVGKNSDSDSSDYDIICCDYYELPPNPHYIGHFKIYSNNKYEIKDDIEWDLLSENNPKEKFAGIVSVEFYKHIKDYTLEYELAPFNNKYSNINYKYYLTDTFKINPNSAEIVSPE